VNHRREFLKGAAAMAAAGLLPSGIAAAGGTIGLGVGNYGLRKFSIIEGIRFIGSIGYDCAELTMMDGYPTEARSVSPAQRREIRTTLQDLGLALPSLLEQIMIIGDAKDHAEHLDRLRRDIQFGHDVDPGVANTHPCVQTHLGGKTADWEATKNLMVDRLGDWSKAASSMNMVIAFKGHNLNLNDTSEKTAWLVRKVNSPWIRVLYDYSHYQAVGEDLDRTMDLLLPYTAMISIKDGKNYTDKPGFERLLPGDGTVDYMRYYHHLLKAGYRGYTVIEISGQIHARPDYDPVVTAKRCYTNVAPVMAKAGVHRPSHEKAKA
jgi:sugar phosphate isomerase/epimerase